MKAVKNNQFYPQKIKKTTTKKTDIKEFHFSRTFFFTFDLGFQISLEDVSTAWVFWKHCYCCLDVSGLCVLMPSSWLEDKFSFFFFFLDRKECIFTIDPSTAKDLDDALSCKQLPDGMRYILQNTAQCLCSAVDMSIYNLSCSILYQIWVSDKFFSCFNCLFSEIAEQIPSSCSLK